MIKVLSKERFLGYDEKGRSVVPSFVTYVSRNKQIPLDLDFPGGIAVSFCNPIKTSRGRLVFPGGSPEGSVFLDTKAPPEQRYKMLIVQNSM